jgi:outer membrane autotransporter protein
MRGRPVNVLNQSSEPNRVASILIVAFTVVTQPAANAAGCPLVRTTINQQVDWSSGDCEITRSGSVSNYPGIAIAIGASTLGTLANNGTLSGDMGISSQSASKVAELINDSHGVINAVNVGIDNPGAIARVGNRGQVNIADSQDLAAAIINAGLIGTLDNSGTINGGAGLNHFGINNPGTIGTLTNSGKIYSGNVGVSTSGVIGTLTNFGPISGFAAGVANGGSIGTLTNSGTIDANVTAIYNQNGIIGILTNAGSLQGDEGLVNDAGTIGALVNHGAINNRLDSIANGGRIGTLLNENSIDGGNEGIFNGSGATISTLANTGRIIGGGAGLFNSGMIESLINRGTIGSAAYAIDNSGMIKKLVNYGTITNETAAAIYNESTGTIGKIANSGTIAGNIYNAAARDLDINGGSGQAFGILTGTGGTTGTITNTLSNLTFGSGNVLLNDAVDVGTNTVTNKAATIQVNVPIAITGNYRQGVGSTLVIGVADGAMAKGNISKDRGYGQLVVSGSANIAPGSSIALRQLNSYAFAPGQRFVVVDASASGTNYNEDKLNYSTKGFSGKLNGAAVTIDDRSDLIVNLTDDDASARTSASMAGLPGPQAMPPKVTSALVGLSQYTGIQPELLNLFDAGMALKLGTDAASNAAGNQLSAASQTSAARAATLPTFEALNIVDARIDSMRQAQANSAASPGSAFGVWGHAYGGHAYEGERDRVDGYAAEYGGMLIGVDKTISDSWRAGGVFSYANTAIDAQGNSTGDSTRVNSLGLLGYAGYTGRPWYANFVAGVVPQRYHSSRLVDFSGFSGTANGHFGGQQYVARAEAGYPLALGVTTITPLAGLTYSYLHQDSYTENGGNGAALSVGATHLTSVASNIGVKIARTLATPEGDFAPFVGFAWDHEYDHARQQIDARYAADPLGETAFTTAGATPVSDIADFSAGVTLLRANNLSLTARYDLQAAPHFVVQTGSLRLSKSF